MITALRQEFNGRWTQERYQRLLASLDRRCETHVSFRVCETPVFLPSDLLRGMERSGGEIIAQLLSNPGYLQASEPALPERFRVPREDPHPLFVAVDFGLTRDPSDGTLVPRLIELQGFPTLFAYQPALCQEYRAAFDLSPHLTPYPPGLDDESYASLFRSAVLGNRAPENVVLLEIDPLQQKTLPDFLLTGRLCGIAIVNVRDVTRTGKRLYYNRGGTLTPIERIYNRTIPEDLEKSGARLAFQFNDDLDVEWAGHPNWFFRMSKFSLPFIDHPSSPKTRFLSELSSIPDDLQNWVLKPLYSFAGSGVNVHPTEKDISAVPPRLRHNYVLQQKVEYAGVVETPHGATKAEVRILYIYRDRPVPVNNLVRMGRGDKMGVDHNRNMAWVGSSAGFWQT